MSLTRYANRGKNANKQREASLINLKYVTFNFTTAEPNGLLIWTNLGTNYIGIGLENGYIKMVWYLSHTNKSIIEEYSLTHNTIRTSRNLTLSMPHTGYLADGEWHVLILVVAKENITLKIDGILAYVEEPGLDMMNDYGDLDLYLGGINQEENTMGRRIFPINFKGCMDKISTNGKYMTNYAEFYSENIKSCQLYPLT